MTFWEKIRQGRRDLNELQLGKEENWTPMLYYFHIKHFAVGAVVGVMFGISFSIGIFLIIEAIGGA